MEDKPSLSTPKLQKLHGAIQKQYLKLVEAFILENEVNWAGFKRLWTQHQLESLHFLTFPSVSPRHWIGLLFRGILELLLNSITDQKRQPPLYGITCLFALYSIYETQYHEPKVSILFSPATWKRFLFITSQFRSARQQYPVAVKQAYAMLRQLEVDAAFQFGMGGYDIILITLEESDITSSDTEKVLRTCQSFLEQSDYDVLRSSMTEIHESYTESVEKVPRIKNRAVISSMNAMLSDLNEIISGETLRKRQEKQAAEKAARTTRDQQTSGVRSSRAALFGRMQQLICRLNYSLMNVDVLQSRLNESEEKKENIVSFNLEQGIDISEDEAEDDDPAEQSVAANLELGIDISDSDDSEEEMKESARAEDKASEKDVDEMSNLDALEQELMDDLMTDDPKEKDELESLEQELMDDLDCSFEDTSTEEASKISREGDNLEKRNPIQAPEDDFDLLEEELLDDLDESKRTEDDLDLLEHELLEDLEESSTDTKKHESKSRAVDLMSDLDDSSPMEHRSGRPRVSKDIDLGGGDSHKVSSDLSKKMTQVVSDHDALRDNFSSSEDDDFDELEQELMDDLDSTKQELRNCLDEESKETEENLDIEERGSHEVNLDELEQELMEGDKNKASSSSKKMNEVAKSRATEDVPTSDDDELDELEQDLMDDLDLMDGKPKADLDDLDELEHDLTSSASPKRMTEVVLDQDVSNSDDLDELEQDLMDDLVELEQELTDEKSKANLDVMERGRSPDEGLASPKRITGVVFDQDVSSSDELDELEEDLMDDLVNNKVTNAKATKENLVGPSSQIAEGNELDDLEKELMDDLERHRSPIVEKLNTLEEDLTEDSSRASTRQLTRSIPSRKSTSATKSQDDLEVLEELLGEPNPKKSTRKVSRISKSRSKPPSKKRKSHDLEAISARTVRKSRRISSDDHDLEVLELELNAGSTSQEVSATKKMTPSEFSRASKSKTRTASDDHDLEALELELGGVSKATRKPAAKKKVVSDDHELEALEQELSGVSKSKTTRKRAGPKSKTTRKPAAKKKRVVSDNHELEALELELGGVAKPKATRKPAVKKKKKKVVSDNHELEALEQELSGVFKSKTTRKIAGPKSKTAAVKKKKVVSDNHDLEALEQELSGVAKSKTSRKPSKSIARRRTRSKTLEIDPLTLLEQELQL